MFLIGDSYVFKTMFAWIMSHYENLLRWALKAGDRFGFLLGTFGLLIFSFVFFVVRKVPVVFFPKGDPNLFMCI